MACSALRGATVRAASPSVAPYRAHVGAFRAERHAIDARDPCIAGFQVAEGFKPGPAFEQHYAPARFRQFLGDDPTASAGPHNHGIHPISFHAQFLQYGILQGAVPDLGIFRRLLRGTVR